jgi:hypothetical protein
MTTRTVVLREQPLAFVRIVRTLIGRIVSRGRRGRRAWLNVTQRDINGLIGGRGRLKLALLALAGDLTTKTQSHKAE